jgi:DNA repair protein RadC
MNSYAIKDTGLFLDVPAAEKKYVLKLRDLPQEEKPREKFRRYGAASLSTAELLAIILNTGTIKEDVLTMSRRVLHEYGELSLSRHIDPEKMSKDLDIPLTKALQIAACAELGKRFFKKKGGQSATIRTGKDAFEYLKDMRDLSKEHLRGIYLNSHHKVIHDEVISIGTIDTNIVHPREVFKPALEYSAVALVLAHNHASGSLKPSDADIEITKQLVASGKIMGIELLDHLIITKTGFASIPVSYE